MLESEFVNIDKLDELSDIEIEADTATNTTDTKKMCRLIRKHLKGVYDDIYVSYKYIRQNDWNIANSMHDNTDSLFYDGDYMTESDTNRFYEIFHRYVSVVIEPIFNYSNQLSRYMQSWSDKSSSTYLKRLMIEGDYAILSPLFVADAYKKKYMKYKKDKTRLDNKFKKYLDGIILEYNKERKLFKHTYREIIDSYVYECPLDIVLDSNSTYVKGFINSIIMTILDFAEKIIELNVYAIHSIVNEIIDYYVPLDDINTFNPQNYRGKKLVII